MTKNKIKGGSWLNIAVHCRSGPRFHTNPGNSNYILGFRIILKKTNKNGEDSYFS